jgi:hypothetical protein
MSKKKSYMDTKNIITEDIFSAFFRGLFTGKGSYSKEEIDAQLKAREKKFKKDIKKDVDSLNKSFAQMASAINKKRKAQKRKPIKAPKTTVDNIVRQAKAGKF